MIIQVSSHRRSGTHALIDFIRENFSVQGDFFHLEDVLDWPLEKLKEGPLIVKTHEPEPEKKIKHFLKLGHVSEEKAQNIRDLTVDVHAYRHPKNVLKSLYYFNLKGHEPVYQIPENMSFVDFMRQEGVQDAVSKENRLQFWQRCVKNWALREDALALDYQTIAEGSDKLIEILSQHLQLPPRAYTKNESLVQQSTAIGRGTTRSMASIPLWTAEAESCFQQEMDRALLVRLKLEGN
jgi:hypothetical protein